METHPDHGSVLRARGLLPDSVLSAFEAGSQVRGWGNPGSDVDLYVVSKAPWQGPTTSYSPIPLGNGSIGGEELTVDGTRWDIRYWTDGQVDELLAKVSHEAFEKLTGDGDHLTSKELVLLERLTIGIATTGADWLADRRAAVEGSAFRRFLMVRALNLSDTQVEDAVGGLQVRDLDSAVLSARAAFEHSVDALITHHGGYGYGAKWRARRFRQVHCGSLSFRDYWDITTMRSFDPAEPSEWVTRVLRACQTIAMEVSI